MSWLAHSTLQSGLWIDNQGTYDLLLDRDRLTLSSAFRKAGWRSVGVIPADTEPWPEGERFYRWEALHDSTNMGYEGPRFGYGRMPDQFALEPFRRLELDRPGARPGPPVMAEIDLESATTRGCRCRGWSTRPSSGTGRSSTGCPRRASSATTCGATPTW